MEEPVDPIRTTHRLLLRTFWKLQRAIRNRLEEFGITPPQFSVLVRVGEEGVPLTRLADKMYSDISTVNGIVNRLEKQGLVKRERCTSDRRVVYIKLTPEGLALRQRVMPVHLQHIEERYAVLSAEELATLQELLKKLAGNL
ncbi:MAG TPA: MarR family transcriptional regulator [Firmicutes bacterium]|nr:MarR family transcriptional regulator [Bacillota bacterium]